MSVGLRGSKKMCRFGVSGVAAPGVAAPVNTSAPQVTRPGVYVARPGAAPLQGPHADQLQRLRGPNPCTNHPHTGYFTAAIVSLCQDSACAL